MQGAYLPRPMRFVEALSLPLRIQADIVRNRQCSSQYLVLSTSPAPPSYYSKALTLDQ